MSKRPSGDELGFRELMLSDLARYRADANPGWRHVLVRCLTIPGLLASLILRAQQCLHRAGHTKLADVLRTVGNVVIGVDFGPGMTVGTGLMLAHPNGVTLGYGVTIGDNVTMAGGVTAAARHYDRSGPQEFPTICDGATLGANAVLVGGVRIGENATVGANSVVLSDVPDNWVVLGVPARPVKQRDSAPD